MSTGRFSGSFGRIWAAAGLTSIGDGVTVAAIPLLATSITHDPQRVAFVTAAATAPFLLFGLIGGAFADRHDRKRILVLTDLMRMVLVLLLGVVCVFGAQNMWVLYLVAFGLGTGQCFFETSAQPVMLRVLDPENLHWGIGQLNIAEDTGRDFIGPPLGAWLFAGAMALPFFLDAASFVASAVLIFSLKGSFNSTRDRSSERSIRSDIGEAFRWLWGHVLLRDLALILAVWNIAVFAGHAIFVLYVLDDLHLTKEGYGVLLAYAALGALAANFVAANVIKRIGEAGCLVMAASVWVVTELVVAVTHSAVVAGTALSIAFGFLVIYGIVSISIRQRCIPDELFGRVNSMYRMAAWATDPLGAVLGGVLATHFGVRSVFFTSAAVSAVVALVLRWRITEARIANSAVAVQDSSASFTTDS
ncbi:MAG: MFS transporter [Acidimicrobiia bacterium]